ncbi:hypothetical protein [Photobacterium lutimaris]|uniref:Uncharacterized protein n=1 Tax=Photobacterium lutimaris TaxID=388278 RepID=A0A2T3ITK5_9GAMM|nr:hypothetical protein [Photobacterium lutimaris]PSU31696.1 hypothetical protein C9I99_21145 [Photobacterium lutimaris]TDR72667.1 hypothetical protein DFP78_113143 [Photobacterium lutimaris]
MNTSNFDAPIQEKICHPELLTKLGQFKRRKLNRGAIIYHGSRERSPGTDYENKRLFGTRKWVSQDIITAVEYAYRYRTNLGNPLLWKLELKHDLICLEGSQFSLRNTGPWGVWFSEQFPNNFSIYAQEILGAHNSYGLLDHVKDGIAEEILVTNPEYALSTLTVSILPSDKQLVLQMADTFR